MDPVNLAVINGQPVTPEGVHAGNLLATGQRIVAITDPRQMPTADRVVDAGGRYVLPGLIDSHVHFRTPGLVRKEGWAHASRAAAIGGITTVIDMPNTDPALLDPNQATGKAALIEGTPLVDFRFHLGVSESEPTALEQLSPRVATSAKIFLTGHHTAPHVSSAEEADLLTAGAHARAPVTFEVTPHHLSFTAAHTARLGARIRLSPSIKHEVDQQRLWDAVRNSQVMTIASDHAPHTLVEKARPVADAPPGLPGVQELLPAVFTGLRRHFPADPIDQHLRRIAELVAAQPAKLFGIAGSKGRLAPGLDADFILFDPAATWIVRAEGMGSKCGWSAYEGWTMTGRVELTVRRGEVIWDHKNGTFGTFRGRWLDASPAVLPASHHRGLACARPSLTQPMLSSARSMIPMGLRPTA